MNIGDYKIKWVNSDTLSISDKWGHVIYIDGGDFESLLSGLCAIREKE